MPNNHMNSLKKRLFEFFFFNTLILLKDAVKKVDLGLFPQKSKHILFVAQNTIRMRCIYKVFYVYLRKLMSNSSTAHLLSNISVFFKCKTRYKFTSISGQIEELYYYISLLCHYMQPKICAQLSVNLDPGFLLHKWNLVQIQVHCWYS